MWGKQYKRDSGGKRKTTFVFAVGEFVSKGMKQRFKTTKLWIKGWGGLCVWAMVGGVGHCHGTGVQKVS